MHAVSPCIPNTLVTTFDLVAQHLYLLIDDFPVKFSSESTVSFSRLNRWTRHTINHQDWQYRYESFLDIIEAETVSNACNDSTHLCWEVYLPICKAQGVFANSRNIECVQVLLKNRSGVSQSMRLGFFLWYQRPVLQGSCCLQPR